MIRVEFFAILLFLLPVHLCAKDLYVNNSGSPACSDATTWAANSAGSPWCTIGRAAWGSTNRSSLNSSQAAQAGDVVTVAPGIYTLSGLSNATTGWRYGVIYQPVNSGTAGNFITFKSQYPSSSADPAQWTTLRAQLDSSGRGQPVIGGTSINYIRWDGFHIDENNAPSTTDTGPVLLWEANHIELLNLRLIGMNPPYPNDNHDAIRVDNCTHILVKNNYIANFQSSYSPTHGGAFLTYYSNNLFIENNEITNSGHGIGIKAPMGYAGLTVIKNNFINNNTVRGIWVLRSPNPPDEPVKIYQNIIKGTPQPLMIQTFDQGSTDPRNVKIVNNTIYSVGASYSDETIYIGSGNLVANAGHVFWNNIIFGLGNGYGINFAGQAATNVKSIFDSEHNVFHNLSSSPFIVYATNYTLANWKTTFSQDAASPSSISSNPLFVDATNNNFRLQSDSPARTLARDILNLTGQGTNAVIPAGAYITGDEVIGRIMGGTDIIPPVTTISTSDPSAISVNSLTVAGSASDAVGVTGCKWRIGSAPNVSNGTACTGTTSFSCATSGYTSGANTLYVGCYDAAGNYGSDSITVNYPNVILATPSNIRILN